MNSKTQTPTNELEAITVVYEALEPLSSEARARVLNYITSLLAIDVTIGMPPLKDDSINEDLEPPPGPADNTQGSLQFSTFAELHDKARPATNADSALLAGYWVQQFEGNEHFASQAINKELKNLGTGVKNITSALNRLRNSKPALVLQVRKGGKSRQARKTYKLTNAGIKRVQEMINE